MIIIHGDNQVESRTAFLVAKDNLRKKEVVLTEIPGDELTLEQLIQASESSSLLGETTAMAIEGFFSRRPSNEKKRILEHLGKNLAMNAVFWEGKDVASQLKEFPITSVKRFDLPKTIWRFLDTFSINDLRSTLKNTAAEMVFSLLVGQVRKLIMVSDGAITLPGWQQGKLQAQAKKYSREKLLRMHQELLDMDYKQKTSASAMDMSGALEVWVVKNT